MAADSKLLIVENILSNPPQPFNAAMDILMSLIGGKERTAEGFHAIASAAGLKVEKIWVSPDREDVAVVECSKA
jgi:hypothetical protein